MKIFVYLKKLSFLSDKTYYINFYFYFAQYKKSEQYIILVGTDEK